jgi:hypothetical protein
MSEGRPELKILERHNENGMRKTRIALFRREV